MELNREPDPKPAPPEPTGAFVEKKKIQVITAVAIAFGLLVAMFLGWLLMRSRSVMSQRPLPVPAANGVPLKRTPTLSEHAEEDYEKGRREGLRSNPAFNLNAPDAGQTKTAQPVAVAQKRTPKDAYEDLLAKAAEADSAVEGGKNEHNSADARNTDVGESRRRRPLDLLGNDVPGVGNSSANRDDNAHRNRLEDLPQRTIPAGTFIDHCVLVNKLDGEYVGPVKVQVSNDVFNPVSGDLVIPQGSNFLGEAQRVSAQFQQRLAVTFDRLQITRDGKMYEIALDKIPGLDQQGATALKDKVNSHYLQIFGASLAIGAIGGLAQIGQSSYGGYGGYDTETQIRNGISQTMAQNASQILNRFLNRLPSVVIRPGTPVVVYIPFGIELQ